MVEFRDPKPTYINGLLGVPKGEVGDQLTRMTTDARPINDLTIELPSVALPNPGSLQGLPTWVKLAAALDIHSFYNCLNLPCNWRGHFGLPAIKGSSLGRLEEWLYPVNTTLPMGWTGSVLIGQRVHERMFKLAIERLPAEWREIMFVDISDKKGMAWAWDHPWENVIIFSIYIDDLNLFGMSTIVLFTVLRHVITEYRQIRGSAD